MRRVPRDENERGEMREKVNQLDGSDERDDVAIVGPRMEEEEDCSIHFLFRSAGLLTVSVTGGTESFA